MTIKKVPIRVSMEFNQVNLKLRQILGSFFLYAQHSSDFCAPKVQKLKTGVSTIAGCAMIIDVAFPMPRESTSVPYACKSIVQLR